MSFVNIIVTSSPNVIPELRSPLERVTVIDISVKGGLSSTFISSNSDCPPFKQYIVSGRSITIFYSTTLTLKNGKGLYLIGDSSSFYISSVYFVGWVSAKQPNLKHDSDDPTIGTIIEGIVLN